VQKITKLELNEIAKCSLINNLLVYAIFGGGAKISEAKMGKKRSADHKVPQLAF
jgi:hypothetical protein